jgi:hypothetical protein
MHRGWEFNKTGQLAILYPICKAKSLKKQTWLWRGITALPSPLLPKHTLKVSARVNTTFLPSLSDEVPCCFLAHSIPDVAWFHDVDSTGCQEVREVDWYVSEVDCKDQFNNVKPYDIKHHFTKASEWLTKRKRSPIFSHSSFPPIFLFFPFG